MQLFFSSLASLEYFTHSLNTLSSDQACQNCQQNNHWVSHGYVYKQQSSNQRNIVGKRIVCANRHKKAGCGRTRQLYLQTIVPGRRYDMNALIAFVTLLFEGVAVEKAYRCATNKQHIDAGHAWQWLRALYTQLGRFRSLLTKPENAHDNQTYSRSRRLTILRPTLQALFASQLDREAFQFHQQARFF